MKLELTFFTSVQWDPGGSPFPRHSELTDDLLLDCLSETSSSPCPAMYYPHDLMLVLEAHKRTLRYIFFMSDGLDC